MSDWFDDSLDGNGDGDVAPSKPRAIGNCHTFADGTVQSAGGFCWFWLILMILVFLSNAAWAVQRGASVDRKQRLMYVLITLISLAVGALNIWIFYHYLKRCECWTGFFITVAISFVALGATFVLAPGYNSASKQWPTEDDWQQLKAAFMKRKA